MKRREAILGTGLLLAAIAEIQFAATFFNSSNELEALCTFAAGAGLMLCAGGMFFAEGRGWTLLVGLAVAAAAHSAYLAVSTIDFGTGLITVASALAAAGLIAGAWAVRESAAIHVRLLQIGFGLASLGGIVWTISDLQSQTYTFVIGDVFFAVGFATAAIFTASEIVATPA